MDVRYDVHRGVFPVGVFERPEFYITERNVEDGENTRPGPISIVEPANSATSYNDPVMKTRITPILRRVGNCSCMTAVIGSTSITRSITTPKLDVGIGRSIDFLISLP